MKRFLFVTLILILISTALLLAACNSSDSEATSSGGVASVDSASHEHNWSEYVTVRQPTCAESGEKVKTCPCGASVSIVLPATGHKLKDAPPCTERKCLNEGCGFVAPPEDHTFTVKETVPPACTEKGYTVYECVCGEEFIGEETEETGHSFGEWVPVTEATCITDGERVRTCTACGVTEEETVEACGHDYEDAVIPPVCEKGGYTEHVCSVCGDSYADSYTVPLWHIYDSDYYCADRHCIREGCDHVEYASGDHDYWVTVFPPTCTDTGYTLYECPCGYSYKDDFTAPSGHAYETVTYPAECTEEGRTEKVCSVCGFIEIAATFPALGHLYDNDCACCDRSCVREGCDHVEYAAEPHRYETVTVPSTCAEEGYTAEICAVCGHLYGEVTRLPLAEHDFTDTVFPPDCETDGYTRHVCRSCGYTYLCDPTEAYGHLYADNFPCCDKVCLREGCTHTEPASEDHTVITVTEYYGCDESGHVTETCVNCGKQTSYEIPAPGHDYSGGICAACGDIDYSYDCGTLSYLLSTGGSFILSGFAPAEEDCRLLIIPDTYNNVPVTAIADFVLLYTANIECIVVGAYITEIGESALYGLGSLRTIIAPYYCSLPQSVLTSPDIEIVYYYDAPCLSFNRSRED